MWKSKFFLVMALLTFLAAGAAVAFQVLEMREYDLINKLLELVKK